MRHKSGTAKGSRAAFARCSAFFNPSSLSASPEGPRQPKTLEQAFSGRAIGAGVFRVDLTGNGRRFTARLDGRLVGDRLTVVEDFFYDDGEENRLTWVFDRTAPGRWTGRREDTVGVAEVVEAGSEIRLSNLADFRSGDDITRLGFEDVIYFGPDGRVINDAIVTRFGVPVGRVRFEMQPIGLRLSSGERNEPRYTIAHSKSGLRADLRGTAASGQVGKTSQAVTAHSCRSIQFLVPQCSSPKRTLIVGAALFLDE